MTDELREAVARAIDDGVRQALRDFDISDEVIAGDVELFAASLATADAALAAIEAAGYRVVKFRVEPGPSLFDEPSENGDEVRG